PPAKYVLLEVSDTGCGMPPDVLEHIFEPFFTTKERGKGTGLGLTTIYGIVKQLGGYIQCYSEVDAGTSFKIYLPKIDKPQPPSAAETTLAELPHGDETLLVVDDEPNIVIMIKQILNELGYRVLCASSPEEALDISRNYDDNIDLVLADIFMPRMNGLRLVENLRQYRPQLKALYMSGYADQATQLIGALPGSRIFMHKPFSFDNMARRMRAALDAPD
ncbi:MAG: response regulator, partial [Lentisphaerae bacterium]|nr:response regulator [Lentisphaerota bacterium]